MCTRKIALQLKNLVWFQVSKGMREERRKEGGKGQRIEGGEGVGVRGGDRGRGTYLQFYLSYFRNTLGG